MTLPKDPVMLYSFINLKLRDFYSDLDRLCEDLDVERDTLEKQLEAAGFTYNQNTNRFE